MTETTAEPVTNQTGDMIKLTSHAETPPRVDDHGSDSDLPFHPVTRIFPMMEPDAFEALKADIKAHGLHIAIWVYQSQIIDGRSRYKACRQLGLTPIFREWYGAGSLLALITSLNLHRHHLRSSQRAMVAGRLRKQLKLEAEARMLAEKAVGPIANLPKGNSRDEAATLVKVSGCSYQAADKVLTNSVPALVDAVQNGKGEVSVAERLAGPTPADHDGKAQVSMEKTSGSNTSGCIVETAATPTMREMFDRFTVVVAEMESLANYLLSLDLSAREKEDVLNVISPSKLVSFYGLTNHLQV